MGSMVSLSSGHPGCARRLHGPGPDGPPSRQPPRLTTLNAPRRHARVRRLERTNEGSLFLPLALRRFLRRPVIGGKRLSPWSLRRAFDPPVWRPPAGGTTDEPIRSRPSRQQRRSTPRLTLPWAQLNSVPAPKQEDGGTTKASVISFVLPAILPHLPAPLLPV